MKLRFNLFFFRYAIAITEKRSNLSRSVGWLDILANDTHQYYEPNDLQGNNSGPSINVILFFLSYVIH